VKTLIPGKYLHCFCLKRRVNHAISLLTQFFSMLQGRLADHLKGQGSSVPQVWSMLDNKNATGLLTAQSLKAPDELKSFVMEHHSLKIKENSESSLSFIKALRNPHTLDHPKINCW